MSNFKKAWLVLAALAATLLAVWGLTELEPLAMVFIALMVGFGMGVVSMLISWATE